jgi:hypothetical protein
LAAAAAAAAVIKNQLRQPSMACLLFGSLNSNTIRVMKTLNSLSILNTYIICEI